MLPEIDDDTTVTWTPQVGTIFKPLKDSKISHGPGCLFIPDGTGCGALSFVQLIARKGFRPKLVTRTIRKLCLFGA